MRAEPDTSLIVVSYNTRQATIVCVEALLGQEGVESEILVVDNYSQDGSAEAVRRAHPQVKVITQGENVGFAKACNVAARLARGRYLGFFNSDCVAEPACSSTLVRFLDDHPEAAVAVPRLVSPAGVVEPNIAVLPSVRSIASEYLLGRVQDRYRVADLRAPTEVEACSGAALLISRADFWSVGGFHEAYFMYVEDVELCRRLGARGRRIFYLPQAVASHAGGASSGAHDEWLTAIHVHNRRDYLRRTMSPVRAAAALLALRVGTAVTPLRDRLLAGIRVAGSLRRHRA